MGLFAPELIVFVPEVVLPLAATFVNAGRADGKYWPEATSDAVRNSAALAVHFLMHSD
jgi:hypothetical protein